MRWYFAMGLDCNSAIVDTLSLRAMITHQVHEYHHTSTRYRTEFHCLSGPAVTWPLGEAWYVCSKRHRLDGPAFTLGLTGDSLHNSDAVLYKEWWINGVLQTH